MLAYAASTAALTVGAMPMMLSTRYAGGRSVYALAAIRIVRPFSAALMAAVVTVAALEALV